METNESEVQNESVNEAQAISEESSTQEASVEQASVEQAAEEATDVNDTVDPPDEPTVTEADAPEADTPETSSEEVGTDEPAAESADAAKPESEDSNSEAKSEKAESETDEETEPAEPIEPPMYTIGKEDVPLTTVLESLLFVAELGIKPSQFAQALECPVEDIEIALKLLGDSYKDDGRGLRVQERAGRYTMVTTPIAAKSIEAFLELDLTTKLSGPALEALSVIAYRQPATRPQIEAVRGVDCGGVIKTLLQHEMIEEVGRLDAPGRPILYGVTDFFMQHFGLTELQDLPPLETSEADILWAATQIAEDGVAEGEEGVGEEGGEEGAEGSAEEGAVDESTDESDGSAAEDGEKGEAADASDADESAINEDETVVADDVATNVTPSDSNESDSNNG